MEELFVTGCGRQNCKDLHSWGPGVRQNYIIHYILHGCGYLEKGGKCYPIGERESFLTCPGEIIHYYPEKQNPWEYIWVDFVGDTIPTLLGKTCFAKEHPVGEMDRQHRLETYFDKLCELDIYYANRMEAAGILYAILGIYQDLYPAVGEEKRESRADHLADAMRLIESNYTKSGFNVEKLSEMLSINRATLYRLFRASLFCSPNEYLVHYRIEQAKKLLKLGFSVKHTAMSCGFMDPFYFSKVYKRVEGVSPSLVATILNDVLTP